MFAVGGFSSYRGGTNNARSVAKLNAQSGVLDASFQTNVGGVVSAGYARSLALDAGTLWIGFLSGEIGVAAAMAINGTAALVTMLPAAWPLARGARPATY